jgi:thiamine-phosphate pyrophosphorylase
VRRALAGGADYATFGPLFDTPSKRAYGAPVGLLALQEAARLGLPLVGLGGVDRESAPRVIEAGAHGGAVLRGWLEGADPGVTVAALLSAAAT